MLDYDRQVWTPGSIGRCAGIWKKSTPHRLSTGTLCEKHVLVSPNDNETELGRVYVYRLRPMSAPARVQYCTREDNYRLKTKYPPNVLAARYEVEQYAINVKVAEMRAAAAAAMEDAAKAAAAGNPSKTAPTQTIPPRTKWQKYGPFIFIAFLIEILIVMLSLVAQGTY